VAERQDRHAEALDHARTALGIFQSAGDRHGLGRALNVIGWQLALLGGHAQAIAYCRQALPLLDEAGDLAALAGTWDSLGYAYHHVGKPADAAGCYRRSLELLRTIGDRHIEALVLGHLGDALCAADDAEGGRAAWQAAVSILDSLCHDDAEPLRARLARAAVS
jgi:tetratricopeptide (TPR) repeat protein